MKENYVVVPSQTAEKWFPDGKLDVVADAVFGYIDAHPKLFAPDGDVILDAVEMSDLVLAREELGLSKDVVPEELFVGIVPRQVGTINRKGDGVPEVIKNNILVGNAKEISNTVLAAFSSWYKFEEAQKGHHCDENCTHGKSPRQRADERRKKRKQEKRKNSGA